MSGFEKGVGSINDQFDINTSGSGTYSSLYGRYGGIGWSPALTSGTPNYNGANFATGNVNGPIFMRFYFRLVTTPSADNTIFRCQNSSNTGIVFLKLTSTGTLQLSDEDGNIGSASGVLEANRWYRVEVKVDASGAGSTDIVEACLDGNVFATSATRNLSTGVQKFIIGTNIGSEAQTQGEWHFDDLACNDSTGSQQTGYPGTGTIINLAPNAAGDSNQFLKSGGGAGDANNYQEVDELNPDTNTTYLKSNTTGHIDFYNVANSGLSSNVKIVAVGVNMRFAGDGASANGTIRCKLKKTSGGTIVNGATQSPTSTSYLTNAVAIPRYQQIMRTVDPDGTEWTTTTVDSMQIGVECVASNTNGVRITQISADVEYIPVDLIATITDNFNDNVLDIGKWSNWGGAQVAETSAQLQFTSTLASGYYGVDSNDAVITKVFDLRSSSVSVKVANAGNQSIPSFEFYFQLDQDADKNGFGEGTNTLWFRITGGTIQAFKTVAGSATGLNSATYNSTTHKYLRIREASGTTYWEYSSNGVSWSTLDSQSNPITPDRMVLKLFIGTWQVEGSTTVAAVDDVNITPNITPTAVTKSLRYAVSPDHAITKSLKYTVEKKASTTKSLRYAVSPEGVVTKSLRYAVSPEVGVTKSLTYRVSSEHDVTKSLKYTVQAEAAVTKTLVYTVTTEQSTTKSLVYRVGMVGTVTKSLQYEVIGTQSIAITRGMTYAVATDTNTQKSLRYAVAVEGPITKSLSYSVAVETPATKQLRYFVQSDSVQTRQLKYDVAVEGVIMKSLAYGLATEHAIQKGLTYIVIIPGLILKTLKYATRGKKSTTKGLIYRIGTHGTLTKGLTYRVQGEQTNNRTLKYAVQTSTAITKSLTYVRELGGTLQKSLTYRIDITVEVGLQKSLRYTIRHYPYTKKGSPYEKKASPFTKKASPYVSQSPSPIGKKATPYNPLPPLV